MRKSIDKWFYVRVIRFHLKQCTNHQNFPCAIKRQQKSWCNAERERESGSKQKNRRQKSCVSWYFLLLVRWDIKFNSVLLPNRDINSFCQQEKKTHTAFVQTVIRFRSQCLDVCVRPKVRNEQSRRAEKKTNQIKII